ncbi:pectinesterase inhibitor 28-like [Curcuma longa]|uniref:pectinesterase inhibitor 28-like n=1 Tax=Curcuma longa TaxID=136217 RepID=UPI003D9E5DA4
MAMAAGSFIFPFIFLFALPPAASSLLQATCSLTSNYAFCMSALQSDPRSLKAADVKSLCAIALRIASADARSASAYAAGLTRNATEARAALALAACADRYRNSGEALQWALRALKEENYDYADMHVSAAQEYAAACGRMFRRSPGAAGGAPPVAYPDAMAEREEDLQRLCRTALEIISQLG